MARTPEKQLTKAFRFQRLEVDGVQIRVPFSVQVLIFHMQRSSENYTKVCQYHRPIVPTRCFWCDGIGGRLAA